MDVSTFRKRFTIIMTTLCVFLAAIVVLLVILVVKGGGGGSAAPSVPGAQDVVNGTISTKYCTMHIPENYSDIFKVFPREDGDGLSVRFYASVEKRSQELFTVFFNEETGTKVGILNTPDGNKVTVSYAFSEYAPDADDPISELLFEYQDVINDILNDLVEQGVFTWER